MNRFRRLRLICLLGGLFLFATLSSAALAEAPPPSGQTPGSLYTQVKTLRDGDLAARRAAAQSLGETADPDAAPALVEALRDHDVEVRRNSATALGKIRNRAPARVSPGVAGLKTALTDESAQVRQAAAEALGRIAPADPAVSRALASALKDSDAGVRTEAVKALEKVQGIDASAISPLVAVLQDSDSTVRYKATAILGKIGDSRAVPALTRAAREDTDFSVRLNAITVLGAMGDPAAIETLATALEDGNAEVRLEAVKALGKVGASVAVPALIAALRDGNSELRLEAARVLGEIGDPAAAPALMEALKHSNTGVPRESFDEILSEIRALVVTAPKAPSQDRRTAGFRKVVLEALGKIGVPAIPALTAALRSGDLGLWRATLGILPSTPQWLAALRALPAYWLLSPVTWFWLLLIWAVSARYASERRLSNVTSAALLLLILALPTVWAGFGYDPWQRMVAVAVGLVIFYTAIFLPSRADGLDMSPKTALVRNIGYDAVIGALIGAFIGALIAIAINILATDSGVVVLALSLFFFFIVGVIGAFIGGIIGGILYDIVVRPDGSAAMAMAIIGALIGLFDAVSSMTDAKFFAAVGATLGAGIGAGIGIMIGPGRAGWVGIPCVAASVLIAALLYVQSNFWKHYFFATARDSLILIGTVLLVWLVLSMAGTLVSTRLLPWLRAKRQSARGVP